MANQAKRLAANVAGNFFVDATCINCDTCRQLAPETFEEAGDYSAVVRQPDNERRELQAYRALLACPVGSIGTEHSNPAQLQAAKAGFPLHLDDAVYYCGFNSPQSFGANSFFVRHPDGNWLIDSPRYIKHLVDAFQRMGGLAFIFLTHEDDVADADQYAKQFGARRIIHRADAEAVPDAEWILDGADAIRLAPQFQAIPVPGHTPGSHALLYNDRVLFTGDHLWWEPATRTLGSPRQLVWNHEALLHSIERLLHHRFEWVLAGHGDRVRLPQDEMRRQLRALVDRRKAVTAF
ncbi:MBL fold metallo-hydrolase [Nitrospira moscoviensis]|uniref:Metallo-beta-lactamase superfamily hydrolase n=1 Tax=Nitrospira moscoviensis TaxID=42253 RepID=A0A0K2G6B3_NITMO|nr:MBL fold metallo-hydrolase [Nitrospira moscoviensis]ALA56473.1 Metallo-beta-lactamase superfamily hydrolase [Nitrospira moscoviensis]